ncbi:putative Sulfotransferase family protein [Vibrio chagasii]|uniref:sulfotransferase family 2 domain-containing protein n=1 Tax=Vibrio chagasii TaxID=170679 RepID=UPI001EFDE299|nr:sulfotransferase family 2 domain-containing protein [Vibrio chagasii]MCG9674490.1 sulfotransferase family protein [Vibrio chagasii]CAH7383108.1 putative Sulfotransferase family protein [Vibrio chagasii]CAH7408309.1 putative Sulfotransferase family protein [Vibrio chagasii]CAH7416162.1 putative Sulfotransferase family protein [Vibrio chagasii]CAH7428089.1 putative Sulfotransferase family protein [Vibrio chagasii]
MSFTSFFTKNIFSKIYTGTIVQRLLSSIIFSLYVYFKMLYKVAKAYIFKVPIDPIEYFTSETKGLSYIVNSKCACSSIKKAMLKGEGVQFGVGSFYSEIHNMAHELGFDKKPTNKHITFTIVRNPYERLVSLYKNKFEDSSKISRTKFEYRNYLGGILKQDMTFLEFIKLISDIPDLLSDRHFKSQYYLVNEAEHFDYFFKLEELNDVFCLFAREHGIDLPKKENSSGKYHYESYLCQESFNLISKRYKLDIDYFGYTSIHNKLKCHFDE